MAEQIGIIINNLEDGSAVVVSDRKGACSGCHSGDGCRSCLSGAAGNKIESRAANPIHARKGDLVRLRVKSSDIYKGAFILYLVPVIGLIAGAMLAAGGAARYGWPESVAAVLAGLVGLALGVAVVIAFDRSQSVRRRMTPTIIEVVHDASDFTSQAPRSSCCS